MPVKAITIRDPSSPVEEEVKAEEDNVSNEPILDTPIHDTGSIWLKILSFILPILGLIAGGIFRKHNYMKNRKSCRKGAFVGLGFRAVLLVLFGILLLLSII